MGDSKLSRVPVVLLASVLVASALLRFLGLGAGLPHVVGPDEGFVIHRALALGAGHIDLERTGKGGLYFLLFVEYGFYFVWLWLTGAASAAEDVLIRFATDPSPFWLIARRTHAVFGVLVVAGTFVVGRSFYGVRVGLFASAAVAVSTLHVERSHFVEVDVPLALLVLLVLYLAHHWADPKIRCRPVPLGLAFGFAMMTKVSAVVLLLPILLANWLRWRHASIKKALLEWRLLGALGVAASVFVAGNPGFLVGTAGFFRELVGRQFLGATAPTAAELAPRAVSLAPAAVQLFREAGRGANLWLFYWDVLVDALGSPLLFISILGIGHALVKRKRGDLLLLALAVPYYCLFASARTTYLYYPRYLVPLIPLLALLAGRLVVEATERLRLSPRMRGALLAGVCCLLLLPVAFRSLAWSVRQGREDTRLTALEWVEANVPAGSRIFLIGNPISSQAPNLFLPLRNTDSNLGGLIGRLERRHPLKARVLEIRKRKASGVSFDLVTVRHFEPNRSLEEYRKDGVRYFVLGKSAFQPELALGDTKHVRRVVDTRIALYRDLNSATGVRKVLDLDAGSEAGVPGVSLEIYRLE